MSAERKKLDVSKATECQKKEILKYAADTRRFEIERFWLRVQRRLDAPESGKQVVARGMGAES